MALINTKDPVYSTFFFNLKILTCIESFVTRQIKSGSVFFLILGHISIPLFISKKSLKNIGKLYCTNIP